MTTFAVSFKTSLLFLVFCAAQLVNAGGPISFSPTLPLEWIVRVDQKLPPRKGITGHMVALANSNQPVSVVVSLTRLPQAEFDKGFKQNARNHFGGVIEGANPDGKGKIQNEKFELKKVDGKQIAEVSCRILFSDKEVYFRGNCWLSEKRLISWNAFSQGAPLDDKTLKPVSGSIQVAD